MKIRDDYTCPLEIVHDMVKGKWKTIILYQLKDGPMGLSELEHAIEGINQKIKTLRRHGYGYPDDEYFFLKIMDMSRKKYIRNEPSHRIYD